MKQTKKQYMQFMYNFRKWYIYHYLIHRHRNKQVHVHIDIIIVVYLITSPIIDDVGICNSFFLSQNESSRTIARKLASTDI